MHVVWWSQRPVTTSCPLLRGPHSPLLFVPGRRADAKAQRPVLNLTLLGRDGLEGVETHQRSLSTRVCGFQVQGHYLRIKLHLPTGIMGTSKALIFSLVENSALNQTTHHSSWRPGFRGTLTGHRCPSPGPGEAHSQVRTASDLCCDRAQGFRNLSSRPVFAFDWLCR